MSILNPYLQMALLRAERDEEHTSEDVYKCQCQTCKDWVLDNEADYRTEQYRETRDEIMRMRLRNTDQDHSS